MVGYPKTCSKCCHLATQGLGLHLILQYQTMVGRTNTQPGWLLHNFLCPLNSFVSGLLLSVRHLGTCRSVSLFVTFAFSCMIDFFFCLWLWAFISSLILLSISLLSGVSRAVKYVNEFLATALCTQVMDVLLVQPCHLDRLLQCMVLQLTLQQAFLDDYFMQLHSVEVVSLHVQQWAQVELGFE